MRISFNWSLLRKLWFSILMVLGGISIVIMCIIYAITNIELIFIISHIVIISLVGVLFIYIGIADRQRVIKEIKENEKDNI